MLYIQYRCISYFLKVDKHIRKLDADLARFESDLKEQHAKEAGFSDYESKFFSVLII